jgi:hypothetical protein
MPLPSIIALIASFIASDLGVEMAKFDGGDADRQLDHMETEILDCVATKGRVRSQDITSALAQKGVKTSLKSVQRRIERLVEDRRLLREGSGRSTRYGIDPYHAYFEVPPTRRKPVGYDRSILADYVPNVTRWVTADESAELEKARGGRHVDASTYTRAITQKLLVDLSYASSALEGNTYTYLDTEVLIQFGESAEGKERDETVMILNHKNAISYLLEFVGEIDVSAREIKTVHGLLSQDLSNMDPREVGSVRQKPVDGIGGSAYKPLAIPAIIEEELDLIGLKAAAIDDPFEQSLFLLAMISYLQAFRDVNKRTGRLACNIPLLKAGLAPMSFLDLNKSAYVKGLLSFYELGRTDLIKAAYIDGYVRTAARYDAYVGRPKEVLDVEFMRRKDVAACVRDYVLARTADPETLLPAAFADVRFKGDPERTRSILVDRVESIVAALGEGNHLPYGITRAAYAEYAETLGSGPASPRSGI